MSVIDAVRSLFEPRRPALADGPAEPPSVPIVDAASTGAAISGPPIADAPGGGSETAEGEDREPTEREKSLMLHLSNVSHGINHFQNQMMAMLYPAIMLELGMSYMEVGILSSVRSMINSVAQGSYGFVTPFVSRCKILGFGNFGIALGTLLSGISGSFWMLTFARSVAGLGASAQHPVGYSILSSYFPRSRAAVMAINTSASNVGSLIATPLATAMLLLMGWREIFFVVAFASVIMGVVYFLFKDYGAPDRSGSKRSRLAQGLTSYKRALKNRNMVLIGIVFMIGAAGGEAGVNQTYFAPHLTNDFGYSALIVGILITAINIGQIGGPILFGWLSDRLSRVGVLQASLALSVAATLWVAWMGPGEAVLFVSLLLYSAVTSSRGTLTQAIVADSVTDADRDAAFSLYFLLGFLAQPIWLLVTGYLMDTSGFGVAVSRLAISYVLAMVVLLFVRDLGPRPKEA